MALSKDFTNLPVGLQRLAALDSLEVQSKRTWTGCVYEIKECSGDLLFSTNEEPKGLFSSGLGFFITLLDINNVEVITLRKPTTFGLGKVEVTVQGAVAATVRQKSTCLKPVLEIFDANGLQVFRIKGPWQQSGDFQYQLTTLDKVPLGAISRKWNGWRKELMTRRDDFTVTFPPDLDIKYKAACIAASVHIIHARRRQHHGR